MATNKMKISIIIPAYNEERRIASTLDAYLRYFDSMKKKLDYRLLVVINNTTDRTLDIVKNFAKKNRKLSYLNLKYGGKGYAIKEGFKHELWKKSDLIGFVDADMSTKPEEFSRLALGMKWQDGVIASRYLEGSIVSPKPTLSRIIVSRIFNLLIRALFFFPYKDTQCGAKIFKKNAIKKVIPHLINTQWAFDVDLIYNLRKFGFKIKEEPTKWSDKDYSKINFLRAGSFMTLSMLRLRLLNSSFRGLVKLYDSFPGWIKIHNKFR